MFKALSLGLLLTSSLMIVATLSYRAGMTAGADQATVPPAPRPIARPALDAEVAKISEALYLARKLDAGEFEAARDYLALSIDLDVLALGEVLQTLPPAQRAAALSALATVHDFRAGKPDDLMVPREQLVGSATAADLRAEVQAVLAYAAGAAPKERLAF